MELSQSATTLKTNMQATKVDDNTLAVTIQPPTPPTPPTPDPVTTNYTRLQLEKQAVDIKTQWYSQVQGLIDQIDTINTAQQANLDQVNAMLSLMDNNGIVDAVPATPDLPADL